MTGGSPSVSVVIPTLNEESTIGAAVSELRRLGAEEIIVADGGSEDRTVEIAKPHARIVQCGANRGRQMNAGARIANGDVLLFLHADVRLGAGGIAAMRAAVQHPDVVGGNFDIQYEGGDLAARVFTVVNRWRRRRSVFYGDSGIFCRRDVFEAMNGYQAFPVMEDSDFARRLKAQGRLALLDEPIYVSDRRWRRSSVAGTLFTWAWIQGLYRLGVSPDRLARWYRAIR